MSNNTMMPLSIGKPGGGGGGGVGGGGSPGAADTASGKIMNASSVINLIGTFFKGVNVKKIFFEQNFFANKMDF